MDASFWHQRWETNNIGFHRADTNPMLVKHFEALSLDKGSRVFLPLCGKTLDIGWLLSAGFRVAGAELSELAITQLFRDLGIKPNISQHDTAQTRSTSTWVSYSTCPAICLGRSMQFMIARHW